MKVVIVGCGRVGARLAETFDANGDDVVVIDRLTSAFDRLPHSFGGSTVRGDGTDEDVLRRAGAEEADVFLALTEGDNRNVVATQVASEVLRVGQAIAKVNDPVRAAAYAELGVATICRTTMLADAIQAHLGQATSGDPGVRETPGHPHEAPVAAAAGEPGADDPWTPDGRPLALPSFPFGDHASRDEES
jgi:trk system potassium uptake protein TrkA